MNRALTVLFARWGFVLSGVLIAIAVAPYATEAQSQRQEIIATKSVARQEIARLQAADESLSELSEIAAARIERGCIPALVQGTEVMVRPGTLVRDGVTGRPVAPGIVFCDRFGNTAVSDETGTLIDFAPLNKSKKDNSNV